MCTFSDCKDGLRQFATRQAWADHEFNEHRMHRMWPCPECHFESSTSTDWLNHLKESHQQQFSDSQASLAIATACRKISKPVEEEKCFLCDKCPSNTRRALIAHIGEHMEEIAMMALPSDLMDECAHLSDSGDGNFGIDDLRQGSTASPWADKLSLRAMSKSSLFRAQPDRTKKTKTPCAISYAYESFA